MRDRITAATSSLVRARDTLDSADQLSFLVASRMCTGTGSSSCMAHDIKTLRTKLGSIDRELESARSEVSKAVDLLGGSPPVQTPTPISSTSTARALMDEVCTVHARSKYDAIYVLYRGLNRLLMKDRFDACNAIVCDPRFADLDITLQLGTLRFSHQARDRIAGWGAFRDSLKDRLDRQGKDSVGIMSGLFDD